MWYDDIKEQFTNVIQYSQRHCFRYYPEYNFDSLFEEWSHNKNKIRTLMPFFHDGSLIYEFPDPVSFGISEETKQERLNRFIKELWDYPYIQDFLKDNRANFFENRIVKDYRAPYGVARKGMKIIKAFKLFFENDDETLKQLQNEASAIMNENKIVGTFCVSIHPLDYLSISDNDHNWHSCHSMNSDYRVGNLNYMADKSTVICYVKTGEDRKINNFPDDVPWNSKSWRMLLFFEENCNFVMAGKQYPVESNEALEFFRLAWKKAHYNQDNTIKYTMTHRFSPWHKTQILSVNIDNHEYKFPNPMIPVGQYMTPIHKIYVPGTNSQQYNDILTNSEYKKKVPYAYLVQNKGWNIFGGAGIEYKEMDNAVITNHLFSEKELPLIQPGAELYCPICGLAPVLTPDAIACDHCAIKYYNPNILDEDYFPECACCGERYIHYEGFWKNGRQLCQNCATTYAPELETDCDFKEEC